MIASIDPKKETHSNLQSQMLNTSNHAMSLSCTNEGASSVQTAGLRVSLEEQHKMSACKHTYLLTALAHSHSKACLELSSHS